MQSKSYFAWYAICMVCIHSCVVTAKHKITIDDPIIPQEVLDNSNYNIGVGIWDITGPAGGVGMMGYAQPSQMSNGVHFRLRARAFIFEDPTTSKRIVFVSTDSCMIFTSVKNGVVNKLQTLYGDMYIQDNVMLSGTHTHSGPAGYAFYAIYNIMSFGFYEDNYQAIVNGIVQAISMAHNNLSSGGKITINSGELLDSNINRSPYAYTANPGWEKAKYKYDVDKTMTLIRLQNAKGDDIGMVNWFAVHGTSMNNTNQLISGDNKGYAAYLFEKKMNGNSTLPGFGPYVSAFAQSNEGDVSPNTKGAHCLNGLPCEVAHSTCGGTSEGCIASGPGVDMFDSTKIIGTHQFDKATELFESATTVLSGPVDYIHTFVDMTNVQVDARWTSTGTNGSTCVGALGDAFAGGTTDGPGDFDFVQGTNSSSTNPYWNMIGRFLSEPPQEQIDCQFPKPILIYAGGVDIPGPWVPAILPLQIFRLGQLFLIGVPGEFTTMSGRRLRDTVRQTLEKYGVADNNTFVVIAGLANAYSHYITTYEEFQYQRYEGGSTLYGPHTLSAYQQEFSALAAAMAQGQTYPAGPTPPDLSSKTFHIPIPQDPDEHPIFGSYGEVYQDVQSTYSVGSTVTATFYGGNPNNDFRTQDTYLTVEQNVNGNWVVVLTDGDWDTRYTYSHDDLIYTLVTAEWIISAETVPGQYRIRVFGTAKDIVGGTHQYTGTSSTFTVSQ